MIGLLAALMLVAGGLYVTSNIHACDGCPAHAKAKVEGATDAAAGAATEATVQAADVKTTSGAACCPSGKAAKAQMTGAGASCATSADAQKASAGKSCSAEGMKTAAHEGCASKEVWSAEATLTKLSHCGIDINNCDVEVLSAKLAEKGCGSYTKEQWTSMITSARALDAKQAETILANVKKEKACDAEACSMKQVAKELASVETESKKN
jgi:hypothetical protein